MEHENREKKMRKIINSLIYVSKTKYKIKDTCQIYWHRLKFAVQFIKKVCDLIDF